MHLFRTKCFYEWKFAKRAEKYFKIRCWLADQAHHIFFNPTMMNMIAQIGKMGFKCLQTILTTWQRRPGNLNADLILSENTQRHCFWLPKPSSGYCNLFTHGTWNPILLFWGNYQLTACNRKCCGKWEALLFTDIELGHLSTESYV